MATTTSFSNAYAGKVVTDRRLPLKSGESVEENQVLALETSSGKLIAYNSSDGASATVHSIAVNAIDASSAEVYGDYYINAEQFNANKLVFENASDDWEDVAEALRSLGINLFEFQASEI